MQTIEAFPGRFKRKLHSLYKAYRCRSLQPTPSWQQVNADFEMKLSSLDLMDRAFYFGDYDPALLCAMRMLVAKGDHCIDIGAHKGYVSLSISSQVGEGGKVFAFEPDLGVRTQLIENVEHNHRNNIQVFPYALGQEEGEVTFFVSEQSGWSSRFPNQMAQSKIKSAVAVPVRVLDGLAATKEVDVDPGRLAFVKVDCEGSEPGVLAGMKDLLQEANPVLWIEVNRDSLEVAGSSVKGLQDIIVELGLSIYTFKLSDSVFGQPSIHFERILQIPTDQAFAFDIVASKRTLA